MILDELKKYRHTLIGRLEYFTRQGFSKLTTREEFNEKKLSDKRVKTIYPPALELDYQHTLKVLLKVQKEIERREALKVERKLKVKRK